MGFAAAAFTLLSSAFYIFVLVQFWRERRRSKRTPDSLTFLGSSEQPTRPLPPPRDERPYSVEDSQAKRKLLRISQRAPISAATMALQTKRNSDRLPYLEITLPITAVVTPVTTASDKPYSKLPGGSKA